MEALLLSTSLGTLFTSGLEVNKQNSSTLACVVVKLWLAYPSLLLPLKTSPLSFYQDLVAKPFFWYWVVLYRSLVHKMKIANIR